MTAKYDFCTRLRFSVRRLQSTRGRLPETRRGRHARTDGSAQGTVFVGSTAVLAVWRPNGRRIQRNLRLAWPFSKQVRSCSRSCLRSPWICVRRRSRTMPGDTARERGPWFFRSRSGLGWSACVVCAVTLLRQKKPGGRSWRRSPFESRLIVGVGHSRDDARHQVLAY